MKYLQNLINDGWTIAYEPGTKFIGATHPNGGKFSIADICIPEVPDTVHAIGQLLAHHLNQHAANPETVAKETIDPADTDTKPIKPADPTLFDS
jgi:hypothetical protein|tara:strand:+ start:216 stop:497 length:282 start_codon:yes stop_codon:yes gene_type:complete